MKAKDHPPKKRQVTFNLPVDLVEEMRSTAVHFAGPPHRLTLAAIAEEAIRRELDRLVRELNKGKAIPRYGDQPLRPGRPIGSGRKG
jgi:hypothetical protein